MTRTSTLAWQKKNCNELQGIPQRQREIGVETESGTALTVERRFLTGSHDASFLHVSVLRSKYSIPGIQSLGACAFVRATKKEGMVHAETCV